MKTITVLLVCLMSCSNPVSEPEAGLGAAKIITGTFDCEKPLPLTIYIEPKKYRFALMSVKQSVKGSERDGTWKTTGGISADFENGKIIFECSVPCNEYRILLW